MKLTFLTVFFFLNLSVFRAQICNSFNGGNLNSFDIQDIQSEGCSIISGDVVIENLDNLSGLDLIEEIQGDVTIANNDGLLNLSGLNLQSIDGSLLLQLNSDLQNIDALNSLNFVGGSLELDRNNYLQNINGLNGLHHVGKDLIIISNGIFEDVDALENIQFVPGFLQLSNLINLKNIDGLRNIQNVTGIQISNNYELTSIDGLMGLTKASIISIHWNPKLRNVYGLKNFKELIGPRQFLIYSNDNLYCDAWYLNLFYNSTKRIIWNIKSQTDPNLLGFDQCNTTAADNDICDSNSYQTFPNASLCGANYSTSCLVCLPENCDIVDKSEIVKLQETTVLKGQLCVSFNGQILNNFNIKNIQAEGCSNIQDSAELNMDTILHPSSNMQLSGDLMISNSEGLFNVSENMNGAPINVIFQTKEPKNSK